MSVTVHEPLRFEVLAEHLGLPEGPVVASDGTLYAVDVDGGRVVRVAGSETAVVARPGGGPNGMALVNDRTAVIANNGGFLWTEPHGVRVPLDLATYTNEPPGFAGGWIERADLVTGEVTVLHTDTRCPAMRRRTSHSPPAGGARSSRCPGPAASSRRPGLRPDPARTATEKRGST